MNEKEIEDAVHQLGVLLADPMQGLLVKALMTDWSKQYNKDFDLITMWDCFQSDVNRIQTVLELHDWLAVHIEEIKKIGDEK